MKKFKTLLTIACATAMASSAPLFFTAAPLALTGCVNGSGSSTNNAAAIAAAAVVIQTAAQAGATYAITPPNGNANNAAYFSTASQSIGLFLTGKDYSPAAFQAALMDSRLPYGTNVWVQLGISTVIDLYQAYYSQYVQGQVNGNAAAAALLTAVQTGFNAALGVPSSTMALPSRKTITVLPRPLKR